MPQYEDLLKDTSKPWPDDNNYFELTITDLNISTQYPLQFRWKYKDGSYGPWSIAKAITTNAESFPDVPSTLTVTGGAGLLTVTWDGKTSTNSTFSNFDRVDVYINGAPFDSSKPAASFFSAGTQTIVAPAGVYIVSSYAVSKIGTKSAMSTAVTRTVTSPTPAAEASVTPSTPTVYSTVGAIQLAWNGKTSTGADQPYGFTAAKVYVGTSSGFTPIDSGNANANQVDVLNFANGQNTLNIAVGTIVNGVAMTYGVDYYVKIKTTNGNSAQDSVAVAATNNPVQIGKVSSGDIVTITADQITAGTIESQAITVGTSTGKHLKLNSSGNPIAIYGTGGVSDPLLTFSTNGAGQSVLSIKGSGTFSGDISAATGTLTNALNIGTQSGGQYPFSVSSSGVLRAVAGVIGGWTLGDGYLQGSNFQINGNDSVIYVGSTGGSNLRISSSGIASYSGGSANGVLNIATNGNITATNVTLSGNIGSFSGTFSGALSAPTGNIGGWTINPSNITGGVTTLNSSGSIVLNPNSSYGSFSIAPNSYQSIQLTWPDFYIGQAAGGGTSQINAQGYLQLTGSTINFSGGGGALEITSTFSTFSNTVRLTNNNSQELRVGAGGSGEVAKIVLQGDGRIYANTLGTTTGTPNIRQDSSGYLRFTSSSSERYKNSIVDINSVNSLDPYLLLNIPVRAFKYNEDYIVNSDQRYNKLIPGFIAEEVEKVYPIAVDYRDEKPETWVANYMIPGILAIIKDLKQRLDALEN